MRTIHVPAATVRPNVCPVCGTVEHVHVSPRSRRRDVAQDRWALTPLGQALLDGLRALDGRREAHHAAD
jgi:hypothetical protein